MGLTFAAENIKVNLLSVESLCGDVLSAVLVADINRKKR